MSKYFSVIKKNQSMTEKNLNVISIVACCQCDDLHTCGLGPPVLTK